MFPRSFSGGQQRGQVGLLQRGKAEFGKDAIERGQGDLRRRQDLDPDRPGVASKIDHQSRLDAAGPLALILPPPRQIVVRGHGPTVPIRHFQISLIHHQAPNTGIPARRERKFKANPGGRSLLRQAGFVRLWPVSLILPAMNRIPAREEEGRTVRDPAHRIGKPPPVLPEPPSCSLSFGQWGQRSLTGT